MYIKNNLLLASLLISGASWAQTSPAPFVMTAPNEYRIIAASPNGKWACGVYSDLGDERYGFLWNLESGEIELLNPSYPSVAYSVSDNGVVVGEYSDNSYRSNGATVSLAGYWADHKWNRLEMPTSTVSQSGASAISPDGHYITGHVEENGQYIGYVWKDGKILRKLNAKRGVSMPYTISPDGQYVAGWIQDSNRQACIWGPDGSYTTISDYESPWSSGRKFTPDGKTLLYYGGWTQVGEHYGVNALYDMATGDSQAVLPDNDEANLDFFDVSNNNTVMCESSDMGYIYQGGKGTFAYKYLQNLGIDLAEHHVFVDPDNTKDSDGNTLYQITRAATVSADDNVMGFQYYNDDKDEQGNYSISMQSMVVKLNQPTTGLVPVSVKAKQMAGLSSVLVSWKPNVAATGISGYNVYRDGQKVNTSLVSEESFADTDVAIGEHKYTVAAVYGSSESAKSDEAVVTVAAKELSAPEGVYATQHGYNSAYMEWGSPFSNFSSLTYYNHQDADIETFGIGLGNISFETAMRFDKTQMSAYKGQKITSVGFYPLEAQGGWKINLYTYDDSGKLKLLYSQPVDQKLNYGERNVVKLNTPQDVPSGDLLIATEVAVSKASQSIVALDYGRAVEGYSDLLRLTTDADFYSVGQLYQAENYLYEATWVMDATISPEGADLSNDEIKGYKVYADGSAVATPSTASCLVPNLKEGSHTLGVSAVYANGSESPVSSTTLDIVPDESQLAAVDKVNVDATEGTLVKASWSAPLDRDRVELQYSTDTPSATSSVVAPSDNNYGIMVGALYPSKTFRGRNGYVVRSARFYPLADATYTVMVYKNDELISETEVNDYTLNEWNEVTLSQPFTIDSKSSYQLVVDCYDVTPESAAIAVDDNNPVGGYSDIYSLDGESWNPISSSGIYGNWLIGLVLENPNASELPVAGYDVNIDGVKKNSSMLTTTSFNYDLGTNDSKEHTISVDVYYTVSPQSVKGGETRFYIGTTGIGDNCIGRIEVRQGSNSLTVSGDNVSSVQLVSTSGATVASADGNTVSLDGVDSGVYVVKAVVAGNTVTRKIMVVK